jgi:hypothetical protein
MLAYRNNFAISVGISFNTWSTSASGMQGAVVPVGEVAFELGEGVCVEVDHVPGRIEAEGDVVLQRWIEI